MKEKVSDEVLSDRCDSHQKIEYAVKYHFEALERAALTMFWKYQKDEKINYHVWLRKQKMEIEKVLLKEIGNSYD